MSTAERTARPSVDQCRTLDEILRYRASAQADRVAYTFLIDGERQTEQLTYRQLYERAMCIAGALRTRRVEREAVLLVYTDGLEFVSAFFGVLLSGNTAVPCYAPSPYRPDDVIRKRLEQVVPDCKSRIALTSAAEHARVKELFAGSSSLGAIQVIATETIGDEHRQAYEPPPTSEKAIPFLLFTSGTTKGSRSVPVTHRNAIEQCRYMSAGFGYDERSVHVGWPPVANTGGFMFTIVNPLVTGFHSVRMSPASFLGKPVRWLKAIDAYRATHAHGPNFAYDLCVAQVTADDRKRLDLSRWTHAINGAEPISYETLRNFAEAFGPCGFRWNSFSLSYGMSECTLQIARSCRPEGPIFSSFDRATLKKSGTAVEVASDTPGARRLPRYDGHGVSFRQIVIVDPETRTPCPRGKEGELWVSGDDVAQGYLNCPDDTREIFGATLNDGRGPFLRTGDLGFMTEGDALYVSGRLKDVIIVRGVKYTSSEMEATALEAHPAVKGSRAAAFAVLTDGEDQLVIVVECQKGVTSVPADLGQAIASAIRTRISIEYQASPSEVVLVRAGTIPTTLNGKIRRSACKDAFTSNELEVLYRAKHGAEAAAAPQAGSGEIPDWFLDIWQSALKVPQASVDQDFFAHGGDSLSAFQIVARLNSRGVRIDLAVIFDNPRLGDLYRAACARAERSK